MTITTTTSGRRGDEIAAKDVCPACGERGRKVKRVTLESLLRPERRGDISDDAYYVCATPRCDTVYFSASNRRTFRKSDLTVRFGVKETDAPRFVCYCFDHTIEEIHDEIRRTGESTVVECIKNGMKDPGCRCEYTNPLGGCCLKTVEAAVAGAFRSIGNEEHAATAGAADHGDCCADNGNASKNNEVILDRFATQCETNGQVASATSDCCQTQNAGSDGGPGRDRAGALAAGGSVVAAILSSACCWLPLVLIAFGASAAGVAGFFEAYRPYFIVGAVGLLGLGFYMVYFRKERCEPGSACATPHRKLKTFNQVMLWTASALVGAFVFFPNYVGLVLGSPAVATVDATGLPGAEYHIEGMTCEGCANTLHGALLELPGVKAAQVDFATKTAVVRYEPEAPVPPDRVIEAVKAAGYSATPAGKAP